MLLVGGSTEILFRAASYARGGLRFDVGPSTGRYLTGFSESEERPPVSFRWTGSRASIDLPLSAAVPSGRAVVAIRYARFLDQPARVHLYVSGRPVATFDARPGRFRTGRFLVPLRDGPLRIDFVTEDPDPSRLGIPIDWLQLERVRFRLPLERFLPRALVLGVFFVALASGLGLLGSSAAALTLAVAEALWFGFEPLAAVHVLTKIALPALLLTAAVTSFVRGKTAARWLPFLFLTGYLLKAAAVFHPSYFYPDVRNHRRYVYALAQAEGSLVERGVAAQMTVRTAYPRRVAGKVYAFPYSPIFFVPFTWLPRDPHLIEDALKHAALISGASEVLAIFWLASLSLGARAGPFAALAAIFLPPMYSRLFLAMWPTVAGHLMDVIAIGAAAWWSSRPESLGRMLGFGAGALASALSYIASLFNLSAFVLAFAAIHRKLALRSLAVWAVAASLTILLLYAGFTATFLREILPAVLRSENLAGSKPLLPLLIGYGERIVFFFGYGYTALAAAGLILTYRRPDRRGFRLLATYLVAFVILAGLRVVSGGLFKDLKEILFVGPMVALATGASLEALAGAGRSGRRAAVLVGLGLVALWLSRYRSYFEAYASLAGFPAH